MMKHVSFLIAGWLAMGQPAMVQAQPQPKITHLQTYQDTTLTDDARIDHLLSILTLEEKIDLLSSNLAVPRLGIPDCGHYEGLHGLTLGGAGRWGGEEINANGEKVATDYPTTVFPQSYGLGCTWDRVLLQKVGEQTAEEARYYMQVPGGKRRALVMRAPNADLARDPRWGRTEESFGEDPYLTAELTVAQIKGLQGNHPRYWKTASLMKHFLANSNEDGRDNSSSDFDNRLFYEYYAYPFYKGITEGGSRAFMAAYNSWNGIPMTIHPCLDSITRQQWGNNGIICTDGGALGLLVNAHKAYPTMAEGAAAVVKATTGQFLDNYKEAINEAISLNLLTEAEIDKAIRGNLYVSLRLGLLDGENCDNPYLNIGRDTTQIAPFLTEEAKELSRLITAKSVVLLKNDASTSGNAPLLPLQADNLRKVVIVGPYGDEIVQDWYSGTPSYETTILQGIRNAVGKDTEVLYFKNNRMGEAARAAADADIALVCVGNHPYGTRRDWFFCPVPSDGREAVDRKSMMLPDEDMVKEIYKANPNTALILVSSFPYTINWSQEHLPAIVHITHCSQEQGNGLAYVLFGKINPAGRTNQTWVKEITDLPDMMDYNIRNGRTYMYNDKDVLYPFGHGLSYTTFTYDKMKPVRKDKDHVYVTVEISNTGDRDGEEVVQIYAQYPHSKVSRPVKQLRAFERVFIEHGKSKEVTFIIPQEEFGYWSDTEGRFVIEPEVVTLLVGASSEDIRLKGNIRL